MAAQALVWLQGPRVVGVHPYSQLEIELCNGVFGWYVRCDGVNASIPKRVDVDTLDLPTAAQLIDAKVEKLAKKAAKLDAEGRSPPSKGKGKGTKGKKEKAAAAGPKRPASAYLLYCKEHREAVKAAAAPELRSMVEVTRALAVQWKALTEAQRAPYEALAGAEKARYQELLAVEPPPTTTSEAGGGVRKAGKPKGRAKGGKAADAEGGVALPAKPAGAFFVFAREHREAVKTEHPEVKGVGPIAKILGQRWAELDPTVKADYQARAAADRARYDEEVKRLTQPV